MVETPAPFYPKVSKTLFLSFMWSTFGLAIFLVIFRLAVRVRSFKRLYWDDGFVLFALVLYTAMCIIWQTQIRGMYLNFELTRGAVAFTPETIARFLGGLRCQIPVLICFYTSLWSIKLSFLIFFKRLFDRVQRIKIWWWVVLVLTVVTWITCIGVIQFRCLAGDLFYIITECISDSAVHFQRTTFRYLMVIDLITDCCIISIPVIVMWDVRIPLKQKAGLIGIFSLTAFIMLIAIIRVALVSKNSRTPDVTWLYFWTNLESGAAIIVSCLASFRQLFVKSEKPPGLQSRSFLSSIREKLLSRSTKSANESSFNSSVPESSFHSQYKPATPQSTTPYSIPRKAVTSDKSIHVLREFEVQSGVQSSRISEEVDLERPLPRLPNSSEAIAHPSSRSDFVSAASQFDPRNRL